jgi:hypothetical protein
LDLLHDRLEFMYGDAIGLSFILDPVIIGDGMCPAHKLRAEDALLESATVGCILTEEKADEMSKQKEQLFIQYTNWVIKAKSARETNDFPDQRVTVGHSS